MRVHEKKVSKLKRFSRFAIMVIREVWEWCLLFGIGVFLLFVVSVLIISLISFLLFLARNAINFVGMKGLI